MSDYDRSKPSELGEAADNVSAMTINYLFFALIKTDGKELNPDFKALFELFFEVYIEKTDDFEFLNLIPPFYAF